MCNLKERCSSTIISYHQVQIPLDCSHIEIVCVDSRYGYQNYRFNGYYRKGGLNGTIPQTSVLSHGCYDFNRANYISLNNYLSEISWYQGISNVFQSGVLVQFHLMSERGIKLYVSFVFRNPSNFSRITYETILQKKHYKIKLA